MCSRLVQSNLYHIMRYIPCKHSNLYTQSVNEPIIYSWSNISWTWATVNAVLDGDVYMFWDPSVATKPNSFVIQNFKFVKGVLYRMIYINRIIFKFNESVTLHQFSLQQYPLIIQLLIQCRYQLL